MTLRNQKIKILSKLIENQSITFKEALLLLNDEMDDSGNSYVFPTEYSKGWCVSNDSILNNSVTYAESCNTPTN